MPNKPSAKHDRVEKDDRAVILRLFERGYSTGELSFVNELVASDFVGYSIESSEAYLGPEGFKTHVSRLRTAFHGLSIEIDDLQVMGDTFEVVWTVRGTHERRFIGVTPTCNIGQAGEEPHGPRIAVSGVTVGIVKNGEIHESEMIWNVEDLRRQLGASDRQSSHDESEDISHPQMTLI